MDKKTAPEQRAMIDHLRAEYPVSVLCAVLDYPRSSYYHSSQAAGDDPQLLEALAAILRRWPFYGYRRVLAMLLRVGFVVGETVVRRILKTVFPRQAARKRTTTTDSRHDGQRFPNRIRNLKLSSPDQVWVAAIT
jgi:hypothetical protein